MMVENLGPYHGHASLQRPSSSSSRSNEGGIPRHGIDMKCLELRQLLQSKGSSVRGGEVDDKVNSFRALLTRQCLDSGESKRRISAVKDSFELESSLKDLHRSGQKHRLELDARSSSRRKKKKRKRDQRKKRRHRRSSTSHSESSVDRQSTSKAKPKIVSYDDDDDDEDDEDGNSVEIDEHYSDQDKKKSRRKKKSRSKTKSRSRSRGRSRQRSHEKKKKKKKAKYADPQPEIEPRKIGRDLASSPLPKLKRMINKRRFSQEAEDLSPENRFTGDESQGKQIVISSIDDIPTLDENGKPVVKAGQSSTGSESKTVEPNTWDSPESELKPVSNGTGSSLLRPPTGRNLKFPKFLPKIIGTSLLNNNNPGPGPVLSDEGVKNVEGPPNEEDEDPTLDSDRERKRSWSRSRSRSYSSNHSRSSSRYSHSPSRSRSRSDFRSSRSRSYSRSYSRSRTRSRTPPRSRTRSPSLPRRTGSPSFKERRRITSARKRPIPYRRKPSHWGRYSSSSERSYNSRSRSRSRSWSRSRSRSRSPR